MLKSPKSKSNGRGNKRSAPTKAKAKKKKAKLTTEKPLVSRIGPHRLIGNSVEWLYKF